MNLETNSILNLETAIVNLDRDNQINIISLSGSYQLDYNFEIMADIKIQIEITRNNEKVIFEGEASFEDIQRNQTYKIEINDLQPVNEIDNFEGFYNEDIEFSFIELTFSTRPDY